MFAARKHLLAGLLGLTLPALASAGTDLTGRWEFRTEILTASFPCGGSVGDVALFNADIVHSGNTVTATLLGTGTVYTGSVTGNSLSMLAVYPEAGGVTTSTITTTISDDNTLDGVADWIWDENGSPVQCIGQSEAIGWRLANEYCTSNVNSTGSAAELSAEGSPRLSRNELTLFAAPVPNETFLFFHGPDERSMPFGDGTLCVGGTLVRILPPATANGNVAAALVDLPSAFIAVAGTRNLQCWFLDPSMPGGVNMSSAIAVPFIP